MSANDDSENHWPGYVDALTTMTMMLIFVMMILAVSIFSMSENVSRNLVETIAKSAGLSLAADGLTTDEYAKKVVSELEGRGARGTMGGAIVAANKPSASGANAGGPGEAADDGKSARLSAHLGDEKRIESGAGSQSMAQDSAVGLRRSPSLITLAFKPRATALDEAAQTEMKSFVESAGLLQSAFELKAYAGTEMGALSDSRRVAYYRAMAVRARLLNIGVPATRISVQVLDQTGTEHTDQVQVFTKPAPAAASPAAPL